MNKTLQIVKHQHLGSTRTRITYLQTLESHLERECTLAYLVYNFLVLFIPQLDTTVNDQNMHELRETELL